MRLRHNVSPKKSPARVGGDDRPETPCFEDIENRRAEALLEGRDRIEPTAFDLLITPKGRASHNLMFAAREAASMCGPCPIRDTCLTDPANAEWALPVVRIITREEAA